VHADGWILTVKLAFFMALGFVHFVCASTPVQPPVTRAVGRLLGYSRGLLKKFELQV
jgi:hypothetical protein